MHILVGLACICVIFALGAPLLRFAVGVVIEVLWSIFFLGIIIAIGLLFHWPPLNIIFVFLAVEFCLWAGFFWLRGRIAKEAAAGAASRAQFNTTTSLNNGAPAPTPQAPKPFIPATPPASSTANAGTNFAAKVEVPNSKPDVAIYEEISRELDGNGLSKGLWTKCFADADGDENKARALYIKSRALELANVVGSSVIKGASSRIIGEFFLEPQFFDAAVFCEDLAAVKVGSDWQTSKYGYVDKAGKLVIESRFDRANGFSDGYGCVGIGTSGIGGDAKFYSNVKWGAINRSGDFEVYPQFEGLWYVREGIFNVQEKDSSGILRNKFIDRLGNGIRPAFLDEYNGLAKEQYDSFIDGLGAVYAPNGLIGYMNVSGNWVIEPKFERTYLFSEGLAAAKLPGDTSRYGYIDKTGRWVIPPRFQDAFNFSDGLASVTVEERGKKLAGYIDLKGDFVIPPQFERGGSFERGIAECRPIGGKTGFIDKTGKFVIDPKFERVGSGIWNGLAPVLVGEGLGARWGYIFI